MKKSQLNIFTPATVAESFGVSKELNLHLWNDIVPVVKVERFECEPPEFKNWAHLVDSKFNAEIKAIELE